MNNLQTHINNYLEYCKHNKRLDEKTLKAYRIDLSQFRLLVEFNDISNITHHNLENILSKLHEKYKPRTAKRKIASIKAFFHHLEYNDVIEINPFNKMHIKFREPFILPKVIPLPLIEQLLKYVYQVHNSATTTYRKEKTLQDVAIFELLFSTGMRISELCLLKSTDVDLSNSTLLIFGKGAKERRIRICNNDVLMILTQYKTCYHKKILDSGYFFTNPYKSHISDQSVRRMIKKYTAMAGIDLHITPHMFRHTFATSLLEADVDIRFIQEILGHSSINITEIYTHVTTAKQNDILRTKHPRKNFHI